LILRGAIALFSNRQRREIGRSPSENTDSAVVGDAGCLGMRGALGQETGNTSHTKLLELGHTLVDRCTARPELDSGVTLQVIGEIR
jgi:hypothetical protein